MTLRRTELLITQVRTESENLDTAPSNVVSDDEIVKYLNDAQHGLQAAILKQHPKVFDKEVIIDTVAGQEAYDLPSDCYLSNKVVNVEYSVNGVLNQYFTLRPSNLKERFTGINSYPCIYIRRTGKILLSPAPQTSSGKIRLNYVKRIDLVDKRRGQVSGATLDTSDNTITSLTLDNSSTTPIDFDSLAMQDYLCVVNKYGTVLMRNIPFSSIDSATGEVTLDNFNFEDGETIPAGSFIVGGMDTTSHSEFERQCEKYLISFAVWKVMRRDSSTDSQEESQELLDIRNEIIDIYADIEDDVITVPIIDTW